MSSKIVADVIMSSIMIHIEVGVLTRSLREPGGPCTKSMEVPESCMERVNQVGAILYSEVIINLKTALVTITYTVCKYFQKYNHLKAKV